MQKDNVKANNKINASYNSAMKDALLKNAETSSASIDCIAEQLVAAFKIIDRHLPIEADE